MIEKIRNKRLFSIIIVMVMLFSIGLTVSAADTLIPEPTIDTMKSGDTVISGMAYPDCKLVVTFPDGTKSNTIIVGSSGNWAVTAPSPLTAGDKVTVGQTTEIILTSSASLDPALSTYTAGDIVNYNIQLGNLEHEFTINNAEVWAYISSQMELIDGTVTIGGIAVDSSHYNVGEVFMDGLLSGYMLYINSKDLTLNKGEYTAADYINFQVKVISTIGTGAPLFYYFTIAWSGDSRDSTAAVAGSMTYDANGADSGIVPVDSGLYYEDDAVTVIGNPGNLQKDDFVFAGWTLDADSNGTVYKENDTFTADGSDIILYAKWISEPTNPSESTSTTESASSASTTESVSSTGTTEPASSASTTEPASSTGTTEPASSTGTTESASSASTTDYSSSNTGDNNNIALWVLILLFSLGMIVTVSYSIFKKKVKK